MVILTIIYILVFIIFALIAFAVMQIKMAGINVKDFFTFIKANEILDDLYVFTKKSKKLSPQEQIIFLMEAEKVFKAFDKVVLEAQYVPGMKIYAYCNKHGLWMNQID